MATDPKRIAAIETIDEPTGVKELQRILGMLNYMRAFIPNMSELTANLRELVKKNNVFTWEETHTESLKRIKEIIGKAPVLGIFDVKKAIVIQTDASKDGLGSVIMQNARRNMYKLKKWKMN